MSDRKEHKHSDDEDDEMLRRDAAARSICIERNRPEQSSKWSEEERDYEFILRGLLAASIRDKQGVSKKQSPPPKRDASPFLSRRAARAKARTSSQDSEDDAVIVRSQPVKVPEKRK